MSPAPRPQNVAASFPPTRGEQFQQAFVAPSSRRDPGAGVDTDERHIRGNSKPSEVRPG